MRCPLTIAPDFSSEDEAQAHGYGFADETLTPSDHIDGLPPKKARSWHSRPSLTKVFPRC